MIDSLASFNHKTMSPVTQRYIHSPLLFINILLICLWMGNTWRNFWTSVCRFKVYKSCWLMLSRTKFLYLFSSLKGWMLQSIGWVYSLIALWLLSHILSIYRACSQWLAIYNLSYNNLSSENQRCLVIIMYKVLVVFYLDFYWPTSDTSKEFLFLIANVSGM